MMVTVLAGWLAHAWLHVLASWVAGMLAFWHAVQLAGQLAV